MDVVPEHIRVSGEWWANPWWLKAEWVDQLKYSRTQISDAFEYLKHVFPAEWLLDYRGNAIENVFLRSLFFGESLFALLFLIELSERLRRLVDVAGMQTVLKNLRSSTHSDAANLETFMAACFLSDTMALKFPSPKPSKGKTPDIEVTQRLSALCIECKSLKTGGYAQWFSNAFMVVSSRLIEFLEEFALGYQFDFLPAVNNLMGSYRKRQLSENEAAVALLTKVMAALKEGALAGERKWVFLSNYAKAYLSVGVSRADSYVAMPGVPDYKISERLISNGVERAACQLPGGEIFGLVAIQSYHIPTPEGAKRDLDRFFRKGSVESRAVSAVLILPWQQWFGRTKPLLVLNRWADADWAGTQWDQTIGAHFEPVLVQ